MEVLPAWAPPMFVVSACICYIEPSDAKRWSHVTLPNPTEPGATNLPAGLVCFLFSDVERSTARLADTGAKRYASPLEHHRAIMRQSLHARNGLEVSTEGDAFFAVFLRPTDAVDAAVDAQIATSRDLGQDGPHLRARMGIHTCQAMVREVGGRVLVSRATFKSFTRPTVRFDCAMSSTDAT